MERCGPMAGIARHEIAGCYNGLVVSWMDAGPAGPVLGVAGDERAALLVALLVRSVTADELDDHQAHELEPTAWAAAPRVVRR